MLTKIILALLIALYIVVNFIAAKLYNTKEMKHAFIDGQCTVGMVCANAFYAPAWALKFLRYIVLLLIK